MVTIAQVQFAPKHPNYLDDCLGKGPTCINRAVLQAQYSNSHAATIRCCDQDGCKQRAAELVVLYFNAIEK